MYQTFIVQNSIIKWGAPSCDRFCDVKIANYETKNEQCSGKLFLCSSMKVNFKKMASELLSVNELGNMKKLLYFFNQIIIK